MNTIKKIGSSTKNFVARHKTGFAILTTAAVVLKINKRALHEHDEFLKEHDLYDEFYDFEK